MRLKIILVVIVLIGLSLFGEQGAYRLYKLLRVEKTLKAENEALMGENSGLLEKTAKLKEPAYLERIIREERGYIRPGEILVEIPKGP